MMIEAQNLPLILGGSLRSYNFKSVTSLPGTLDDGFSLAILRGGVAAKKTEVENRG